MNVGIKVNSVIRPGNNPYSNTATFINESLPPVKKSEPIVSPNSILSKKHLSNKSKLALAGIVIGLYNAFKGVL